MKRTFHREPANKCSLTSPRILAIICQINLIFVFMASLYLIYQGIGPLYRFTFGALKGESNIPLSQYQTKILENVGSLQFVTAPYSHKPWNMTRNIVLAVPHGSADGAEIVSVMETIIRMSSIVSVLAMGFLNTSILTKGYRINVNRATEKHWTWDPKSKTWSYDQFETPTSTAATIWYNNAVRCATNLAEDLRYSPLTSTDRLDNLFTHGKHLLIPNALSSTSADPNETMTLIHHTYPSHSQVCPRTAALDLFIEIHRNGIESLKNEMQIVTGGFSYSDANCMHHIMNHYIIKHESQLSKPPLTLRIYPANSTYFSYVFTTSISHWAKKGMVVEFPYSLSSKDLILYTKAFTDAIMKCF